MRTNQELVWNEQRRETASNEAGQQFLRFFDEVMDETDRLLAEGEFSPARCFNTAAETIEKKLGYVELSYLGPMLLLAATYWVHGDALVEGLTYFESKVLQYALSEGVAKLRERGMTDEGIKLGDHD